ncbi:hypothetical protein cypCar_00045353, partial [Cyprinus carpio]
MFNRLNLLLLLLLCLVYHSENISKPVSRKKGGNITLTCEHEDNNIVHTELFNEISVKTGEELKMSVLLSNAAKVKTNSSGEWKEVWSRTDEVQSDRMNENDKNLIIKLFTARDAGTYRVLDSEGEILITVTITESKDKLYTDKDKPDDTGQY